MILYGPLPRALDAYVLWSSREPPDCAPEAWAAFGCEGNPDELTSIRTDRMEDIMQITQLSFGP